MRSRAKLGYGTVLAMGFVMLAGCSGSPEEPHASPSTASEDGSGSSAGDSAALKQAFARIDPDALGTPAERSLEFGATPALVDLAADDERWSPLVLMGQSFAVTSPQEVGTLGIKGKAADYAVTAGAPPSTLYLVAGGQDSSAIESGANELGYQEEDGVLSQALNPAVKLSVSISQISVDGGDVLLGGPNADLELIGTAPDEGSGGLLDDAQYAALAECLGEVPAAMATDRMGDGNVVGVGVQDADGAVQSVMCVVVEDGGDPELVEEQILGDLADGQSVNGISFSELLTDPASEIVDAAVKVTVKNSADAKPMTIFQMLQAWDIPGVTAK